jgi:Adenylosuccinate synthetase (EC 6.3.4.4)
MVNGFNELALTKLDVLSGMDELKVCTQYRYDGKTTERFPSEPQNLTRVEPQYHTLPGWEADISGVRHVNDLPGEAQEYLAFIEDHLGVEIGLVSNGPRRSQIITDVQPMAAA